MSNSICVYGDSILRATVPDEQFRYHFNSKGFCEKAGELLGASVRNRARMGALSSDGLRSLEKDLEKGEGCDLAVVEFGGNDCDFDWKAVSEAPGAEHRPRTELGSYLSIMERIGELIARLGARPVFLNLPPIDARRYLSFITRGGLSRENILRWLGDEQRIYRFQELYSASLTQLVLGKGWRLIDLRTAFLRESDCGKLISADGIHPSMKGYELIFDTLMAARAN